MALNSAVSSTFAANSDPMTFERDSIPFFLFSRDLISTWVLRFHTKKVSSLCVLNFIINLLSTGEQVLGVESKI